MSRSSATGVIQREGGARRTGFRVRLTGSALVGFRNRKFVTTPAKVPITRRSRPTEEQEEEEDEERARAPTHTNTHKNKKTKKKTSLRFPTCFVFVTFLFFFFFSTLSPKQFDASLFSAMTLLLLLHSRLRVP